MRPDDNAVKPRESVQRLTPHVLLPKKTLFEEVAVGIRNLPRTDYIFVFLASYNKEG